MPDEKPSSTSSKPPRTRVMCVDDSVDLTEMLAALIGNQPDLEDVGTLNNVESIVAQVQNRRAMVVVLDLTIPGGKPLDAIRALASKVPLCRVIAYSGYDDELTRIAAAEAGAWELVSKGGEPDAIIHAIRRVAAATPSLHTA